MISAPTTPAAKALGEIVVPAARSLGFTAAELHTICRVRFPLMRQCEVGTHYAGRPIGLTPMKSLPGMRLPVAPSRAIRATR